MLIVARTFQNMIDPKQCRISWEQRYLADVVRMLNRAVDQGAEAHRLIEYRLAHGATLKQAHKDARNFLRFGTR